MKYNESDAFYVGLDIGTNSLGWSVSFGDGRIPQMKRRPMQGVVLIQDEGQTAEKRRLFRSMRRRLARRKQRIEWLQELMAPIVLKDDPTFFQRLKYSYIARGDENCSIEPSLLFDNSFYKTHAFHEKYPTIYHLRKEIIESKSKVDIRLVYLAIHHIIKYRGNFLYEGQKLSVSNIKISDSIGEMLVSLGITNEDDSNEVSFEIEKVLFQPIRKSEKKEQVAEILIGIGVEKPCAVTIASLIIGYAANITPLFELEEKKSITFSNDKYLEAEEYLDDEQMLQLETIQKVYSGYLLSNILSGKVETLSDAFITVYNNHKEDLLRLKRVLKQYCSKEEYKKLMDIVIDDRSISYAANIKKESKCSNEQLCKEIKKKLLGLPLDDEDVAYCLSRIEDDNFLKKPRNSNNGSIPNQLQVEDLCKIIDSQKAYYPELESMKDKLVAICSFRIPYYVGPLSTTSNRAWLVRDAGMITPWNFEEKVDIDKSAQEFIQRMTNRCTYLVNEYVLPKKSLLYSEFCVLNELANIKINGYPMAPDCKMQAINDLFKIQKAVSKKAFIAWYKKEYLRNPSADVVAEGFSDENKFTSDMASFVDLSKIIGSLENNKNYILAERIIEQLTLFEDKKILLHQLKKLPELSDEQIKKVLKLKYSGWGRLSKRLLAEVKLEIPDSQPVSIIEAMRTSTQNFQSIFFDERYRLQERIDEINKEYAKDTSISVQDFINKFPGSPALKKCTNVAVKVVDEISKVMGKLPAGIFIEVAAGDEKKGRTISRYDQLKKIYSEIKNNPDFSKVQDDLKQYRDNPKELDNRALLLYFLQNGKCLYSGKPLDINNLSSYQIDHILPRSFTKDDSIENLALVISSENQRKRDSLLLDDEIIARQQRMWKQLLDCGLIGEKKYHNLCRKELSDEDFNRFINRQLVETRQICTNVFNCVKQIYDGQIPVYGVSAKLSASIKSKIGIPKIRELNDYHHAVDAYVATLAGLFNQKYLSAERRRIHGDYLRMLKDTETERVARYGIITELFCSNYSGWNGIGYSCKIRNCSKSHDFFMNCLVEEQTGEFYNQTLVPKPEKSKAGDCKLIPRKADMDPSIYGGYSGEKNAYYCVVDDRSKSRNKAYHLVGIPIRIAALMKTNDEAIANYLKGVKGFVSPVIVKDKIKKYQHILYHRGEEVNDYYLTSDVEVINAKQLWLSEHSVRTLDILLNSHRIETEQEKVMELFDELCSRMSKFYPCYSKISEALIKERNAFSELGLEGQKKMIKKMLLVCEANSQRIDKPGWKIEKEDGEEVFTNIPSSRMTGTLKVENIEFVDSSITGMFVRRYRIGI